MNKNKLTGSLSFKIFFISVIFFTSIFISFFPHGVFAHLEKIDDGVAWLKSNQNLSGSWGDPGLTEYRDTTVVADILKKMSETGTEYTDALDYLNSYPVSDNDSLARMTAVLVQDGQNAHQEINSLISAKNSEEIDSSFPNYPEGGWGPYVNYSTTSLDTSLSLGAISHAPIPKGLLVMNKSILAGETQTFYFDYPADASNFSIFVSSLSGNIDFRIFPNDSSSYSYWGGLTAPTYLGTGGLTIVPGARQIQIYANANSTYSFQITLTSGGYDSSVLINPVAYLLSAQNPDGGWGLSKGSDSNLFITTQVLIALGKYDSSFDLSNAVDNGIQWLKNNQNGDGGFGTDYETALGYMGLAVGGLSGAEAQNALSWILAAQDPDGSWNSKAYDTAISMQALYTSMLETDTDSDGVPDVLDNCPDIPNSDQLNTDGDTMGDVCDPDDDNDGLTDDFEINLSGTNPLLADSDNDGIDDGLEDMDFDGVSNEDEAIQGTDPMVPDIWLVKGLNLFGYPVSLPVGYTSYDLLYELGSESEVDKIQRFNSATGTYETTEYQSGIASGDEFAIVAGQGYLVYMNSDKLVSFVGDLKSSPIHLEPSFNLVSLPSMPSGFTSYDLLSLIGDETVISSIQRFNTQTGVFETTAFNDGVEAGILFNIINSEAYMVHVNTNATIPALLSTPLVTITSHADGQTLISSPIDVSGTVSDNSAAVTVNGISAVVDSGSFSASDITLDSGDNSLIAKAINQNNMMGTHIITLTLDEGVDYEISKGGSTSDTRRFQGDSALLDQTAFYTESITNLPSGVTYTTNLVSRVSATEFEIGFLISVSPATAAGTYEFSVEYNLLDGSSNSLTPLSNNIFEFMIKILP